MSILHRNNLDFRKRKAEDKQLLLFLKSSFEKFSTSMKGYEEGEVFQNCINETWLVKSNSDIPTNEAADYVNSFFSMSLLCQDFMCFSVKSLLKLNHEIYAIFFANFSNIYQL